VAPSNALLPGGGGYIVPGLYNLNPAKVGLVDNYVTFSDSYGKQIEHWNGVDVGLNARLENGLFFFGGFNIGKTAFDECDVVSKVPESLITAQAPFGSAGTVLVPFNYCRIESPWLVQLKANAAYTLPKADVLLSGTFFSVPGPPIQAMLNVNQRADGTALNFGNQLVSLLPALWNQTLLGSPVSTSYGERLNQRDLRIAKVFKYHKSRAVVNFDVVNLFNTNSVIRENVNFTAFRQPVEIALARYLKIGAQFDF
jgi:hypothetical protein